MLTDVSQELTTSIIKVIIVASIIAWIGRWGVSKNYIADVKELFLYRVINMTCFIQTESFLSYLFLEI
jgi:hypothetical protein